MGVEALLCVDGDDPHPHSAENKTHIKMQIENIRFTFIHLFYRLNAKFPLE